jgi:hypothetical protein
MTEKVPASSHGTHVHTAAVLDEGEKIGIDHVGVRRSHALRELLIDFHHVDRPDLGRSLARLVSERPVSV